VDRAAAMVAVPKLCFCVVIEQARRAWDLCDALERRDDTYFICAENLAVDRPKPERSVARGLGVVITYCRLRASISALLISP